MHAEIENNTLLVPSQNKSPISTPPIALQNTKYIFKHIRTGMSCDRIGRHDLHKSKKWSKHTVVIWGGEIVAGHNCMYMQAGK